MLGPGEDTLWERGTSTTIGMMLMVGVVVILSVGAVAGVFAVVLGPPPVAPQLAFEFDYTNSDGADSLVIEYDFGDAAAGDLISINVHNGEPSGVDGSYRWDGAKLGGGSSVTGGQVSFSMRLRSVRMVLSI